MYIHYVALDTVNSNSFIQEKKNGLQDFLLLYMKCPSTFIIANIIHTVQIPSILLIDRFTPFKYFPNRDEYIDDYLHFSPENPDDFIQKLYFPLNIPIPISNNNSISKIMESILEEFKFPKKNTPKTMELLIDLLMIRVGEQWELADQDNINNPHYKDLLKIRDLIRKNPEKVWTIEELADQAHLSNAYFQVLYKKTFGISCINDVIQCKMAASKNLLSSTNLTIAQISKGLGYNDSCHFIRQFKKNTGITPGAFRKKARD